MDVASSTPLKLHPVADVANHHRVVVAEQHLLPEHLDPMLEVPRCQQNILPDHLVLTVIHLLFKILAPRNLLSCVLVFHHHFFFSAPVHIVVDLAPHLLQDAREVGTPPEVSAAEGEEPVERSQILQLGYHLMLHSLPVLGGPRDSCQDCKWVLQGVACLTTFVCHSLSLKSRQVGIAPQPCCFHVRHCSKHIAWHLGEPFILVEYSLLEILLC